MTEHQVRAATAKALPGYDVFTMSVGDYFGVGIVAANGVRIAVRAPKSSRADFAVDMLRTWLSEDPARLSLDC